MLLLIVYEIEALVFNESCFKRIAISNTPLSIELKSQNCILWSPSSTQILIRGENIPSRAYNVGSEEPVRVECHSFEIKSDESSFAFLWTLPRELCSGGIVYLSNDRSISFNASTSSQIDNLCFIAPPDTILNEVLLNQTGCQWEIFTKTSLAGDKKGKKEGGIVKEPFLIRVNQCKGELGVYLRQMSKSLRVRECLVGSVKYLGSNGQRVSPLPFLVSKVHCTYTSDFYFHSLKYVAPCFLFFMGIFAASCYLSPKSPPQEVD